MIGLFMAQACARFMSSTSSFSDAGGCG